MNQSNFDFSNLTNIIENFRLELYSTITKSVRHASSIEAQSIAVV